MRIYKPTKQQRATIIGRFERREQIKDIAKSIVNSVHYTINNIESAIYLVNKILNAHFVEKTNKVKALKAKRAKEESSQKHWFFKTDLLLTEDDLFNMPTPKGFEFNIDKLTT